MSDLDLLDEVEGVVDLDLDLDPMFFVL